MTPFEPRRACKRIVDIVVSATGLVVSAPVVGAVAVAVRVDSPGPVLFRQRRIGMNGRPFHIHKFRTMQVAVAGESRAGITAAGDPRVTRVGAWLRRSKLDELPQLVDVFRGDMSLVGPRPEVPQYVEMWDPEMREVILSVRPGITDPASLAGLDEAAELATADDPERYYIDVLLPRKQQMYVDYVRTASFLGDLRLVLATLTALVRR